MQNNMLHAALDCDVQVKNTPDERCWCPVLYILTDIKRHFSLPNKTFAPLVDYFSVRCAFLRGKKKYYHRLAMKHAAVAWCGECIRVMILFTSPTHCYWLGGRTIVLAFHSSTRCGSYVLMALLTSNALKTSTRTKYMYVACERRRVCVRRLGNMKKHFVISSSMSLRCGNLILSFDAFFFFFHLDTNISMTGTFSSNFCFGLAILP